MYRDGIHGNYDITVIYEERDGISNVYVQSTKVSIR